MKRTQTIVAVVAGGLSLAVLTAFAAGPGAGMGPCQAMGAGMGPQHKMGSGMGMMHGNGPGMMAEQKLDQVKTRLGITPAQEGAWQAYAAKAGEQAAQKQTMHAQRQQAADAATPAPERMEQHLALMSQHLAGMQGVSAALGELYAVLTPEQRVIADQQLGPMGRMGPMGRGSHGHGHGARS
jgi:hypothetical protein